MAGRQFDTGATRDGDETKIDFEGFLSPDVIECYGDYMHRNRFRLDGTVRDSDNWQLGIPIPAYMKSLWRHFFAVWKHHRGNQLPSRDELCAVIFNASGMLHEVIKAGGVNTKSSQQTHGDETL